MIPECALKLYACSGRINFFSRPRKFSKRCMARIDWKQARPKLARNWTKDSVSCLLQLSTFWCLSEILKWTLIEVQRYCFMCVLKLFLPLRGTNSKTKYYILPYLFFSAQFPKRYCRSSWYGPLRIEGYDEHPVPGLSGVLEFHRAGKYPSQRTNKNIIKLMQEKSALYTSC